MADNKDYARGKCPICGTDALFRINKNGILYTICRKNHRAQLDKFDSIDARASIDAGAPWHNGLIHIYPLNHQINKPTEKGQEDNVRREQAIYDRHSIERRADNDNGAGAGTKTGTASADKPKRGLDIGFF